MVKRAASLFGAGIVGRKSAGKRAYQRFISALPMQHSELLEARVLLSASSLNAVNVVWNGQEAQAVAGEYVAEIGSFSAWSNLVTKENFTNIRSLGGDDYQFDSAMVPAAMLKLSKAHPLAFKAVEPNFIEQSENTFPDDPLAVNQWGLLNTGQNEPYYYNLQGFQAPTTTPPMNQLGTVGEDIDVQQAWDITTGSSTVVVAVLDTGIDLTHPDLIGNIWTNPDPTGQLGFPNDLNGWNFVANDANVQDDNGHGTHVSGIIGASGNNSIGVTGVNWHVSILPVKVLDADGTGTSANILAGINYVTMLKSEGVNIVVMNESLGGNDFPEDVITSNALKSAGQAGILDVVAAGNAGTNNDRVTSKPASQSIAQPNVITVAAIDNQGKLAAFSNFGANSVQLAAPGIDILSTAPTYDVTLTTESASTPLLPQFSQNYGYLSGTSMAAPFVTGIIALEASVVPNATPQQLRTALLNGVTFDPYLAAVNSLPQLVTYSGVANAYGAVKDILNQFVTTDTTRHGNFAGFYGSQGAYVVGDSTTFPTFVDASFNGVSPDILKATTRDVNGLQNLGDPSTHIDAYDAASSSETINLNFNDGIAHQVGLYVADLDHKHRSEQIQIIDSPTGLVLSSQAVSNFTKGEYLFYDLRGSVQIKITRLTGPTAVFSGIFFDAVPGNPNVYTSTDPYTSGFNWQSTYGSQGEEIVGDPGSQLPGYVTSLTTPGASATVLKVSKAAQSLQFNEDATQGIQAYYESPAAFNIDIGMNNTQLHQITLYLADYTKKHRAERIQVIDPATQTVLYTRDYFNFNNGVFTSFTVPGDVTFRITPEGAPGATAVVSGIFFDATPGEEARFAGTDATTHGTWKAAGYGAAFADIVGVNFPGIDDPQNPTITVTGATERILNTETFDARALQNVTNNSGSQRVEGYIYSPGTMTLHVDFGDNLQHHVAMYFADYENLKRMEMITITNPVSGTVLAQQRIARFQAGKYLLYDITGPVDITITAESVGSAVLSGIFAD